MAALDSDMATQADVRRIALALPNTAESKTDFAFHVLVNGEPRGFAWCWKERVNPKKPRVPNLNVLVVHVGNLVDKDFMMTNEPDKFIHDPHYNGYAAVIMPLAKVRVPQLRALMTESHRIQVERKARKTGKPRKRK